MVWKHLKGLGAMIDFENCDKIKIAYASPSYRRPVCRTARYIKKTNVYIDKSDEEAYREANKGYGNIVVCKDGIQGNLPRVRNYILDQEFGNGADIVVMMDDDINYIGYFDVDEINGFGYVKNKIPGKEIDDFILYGSLLCQEWGFGMWGCNHYEEPLYYNHFSPFSTQNSCVGQFMVFIKDDLRFDEKLPLKEDYDMSIQQLNKYRGTLTLKFCYCKGDFGKLAGGTAVRRNHKAEFEQFKLFKKKWGSEIVKGTNELSGGKGKKKTFIKKYDFSHPVVKCPIKGI